MSDIASEHGAEDAARAADVLLGEARIALVRAEERASNIETKASWLLAGLVPSLGLISIGLYRQAQGTDLSDALSLAALITGCSMLALLLAATIQVLRTLDLSKFQLIERAWVTEQIETAERHNGTPATALTLGVAHGTLTAAGSAADRANLKIRHFQPAMVLVRISVWGLIPYALFTLVDLARSAT